MKLTTNQIVIAIFMGITYCLISNQLGLYAKIEQLDIKIKQIQEDIRIKPNLTLPVGWQWPPYTELAKL